MMANSVGVRTIDDALKELNAHPDSVGLKANAPDFLLQRYDPAGVKLRADIADLESLTYHQRSGAAVTAIEEPRLKPFVPSARDSLDALRTKLERMRDVYVGTVRDHYQVYGPEGGFRSNPRVEEILKERPKADAGAASGGRPPLSSFQRP
jgi:hypothetical protein